MHDELLPTPAEVPAPTTLSLACPACRRLLAASEIDVAADLARCPACDRSFKASELTRAGEPSPLQGPLRSPAGSKIVVSRGLHGDLRVVIPARGWTLGSLGAVALALLIIAFTAVWAVLAAGESAELVLWVVPFWCGAAVLGGGAFAAAMERQTLTLEYGTLAITKHGLFGSKTVRISAAEISTVRMGPPEPGLFGDPQDPFRPRSEAPEEVPKIAHGTQFTSFGERVTLSEKLWLVETFAALQREP